MRSQGSVLYLRHLESLEFMTTFTLGWNTLYMQTLLYCDIFWIRMLQNLTSRSVKLAYNAKQIQQANYILKNLVCYSDQAISSKNCITYL